MPLYMGMEIATGASPGADLSKASSHDGAADAERVRAALAGDLRAYGDLYDRYARLIRAVCRDRIGNLDDAQDLCQEVFLRAHQNLTRLRDANRFAPWLLGIARLTCSEWRKRAGRERRRREVLVIDPVAPQGEDGTVTGGTDLLNAVAALPERERLALHLFYLQEHPAEVAQQMMALSRSGFYRVLDRARRRLRRVLAARGEDGK